MNEPTAIRYEKALTCVCNVSIDPSHHSRDIDIDASTALCPANIGGASAHGPKQCCPARAILRIFHPWNILSKNLNDQWQLNLNLVYKRPPYGATRVSVAWVVESVSRVGLLCLVTQPVIGMAVGRSSAVFSSQAEDIISSLYVLYTYYLYVDDYM